MTLSVPLKKYEIILGLIYLVLELFLLPMLCTLLGLMMDMSLEMINFLYFCTNFLCVTLIFHHFLIESFKIVAANPWKWLRACGQGIMLYFGGNLLISTLIISLQPDFSNINDQAISEMAAANWELIAFGTVLLVPVAEETLFRGLIFRGLFDRSRVLAYAVSTLAFAAIHVTGYIGIAEPLTLVLCFLQYLPAGLSLAYAYQRSDTIWAPILMHIAINQIGMSLGG